MGQPREHLSSFSVVMARQRRAVPAKSAYRRLGDLGLFVIGACAAAGSASFAGYMITADNSNPRFFGSEHLMLFAQPIRSAPVAPVRLASQVPESVGVDFTPVGSIPAAAPTAAVPSKVRPQVGGYTLREAHDGIAIVDGPRGSFEIITGATLPAAGKVIAIERRAGKWQVVTETGVIAAQR